MKMKATYFFLLALVCCLFTACMDGDWDEPNFNGGAPFGNNSIEEHNVISISELIKKYPNVFASTDQNAKIEEDIQIKGRITGNDLGGNIYKQVTLQDSTGAIIIAIDPATAKEQANKQSDDPDKTALISVYGNKTTPLDDNAQQQLADRINKALPRSAKAHAITGDEYRDESTKSTQDALGFIQPLILIFAVIALFVGSFIIANTF